MGASSGDHRGPAWPATPAAAAGPGGDVTLLQRQRSRRSPRALPVPGSCRAIGDPRKREVTKEEGSRRLLATPGPNTSGSEQNQTGVAPRKRQQEVVATMQASHWPEKASQQRRDAGDWGLAAGSLPLEWLRSRSGCR